MGCAVWKAPSFVLVCVRYVATWNGQRATPRTAGLAAVASAVAGASACTRSAGPLMQLGPGSSPRESLPRRGLTAAWRHMAAARGCRVRVGRFLCFDLPGGRPYALPFRVSSSTYCYRTRSHAPPPARRSTRRASSRDTMPRGGARNGAKTISRCYELDVPDCRRLGTYTVWSSIVYAMDTPHGAVLGNYTLYVY